MKITKRVLTIIISIALVFGGLYYASPKATYADADFAITAPRNGLLKAAGFMDIKWEDASSINEVDSYDVFVDGSLVGNTKETKFEFYTTKVNFHRTWVRANFKDGTNHYTKTINFAVTKKGLATEPDMSCFKIDTKKLGIGWYYNWGRGSYQYHSMYRDLEYVPMVWGDKDIGTIRRKMQNAIDSGSKYMLGFNEPDIDHSGGCNIPNSTVISLWPHFMAYSDRIKVGSPAYALWPTLPDSKFSGFMVGVENNVDFVCLHCYPRDWNGGKGMADWFLTNVIDGTYNMYHKPIWFTEYATAGNGITDEGTAEFIKYLLQGIDSRDYVERHSFFSFPSFAQGGKLYDYTTGTLTKSGENYAKYGNPERYYYSGTEVNPRDSVDPTLEPFTEATTAPVTTAKPTQKPTAKAKEPDKAKIQKAKYKKKRKIKITLKKVKGAKGYHIRYSDSKKFDGYWDKYTKKTKVTLKKLDKNTKYYIKARAYKLVNGAKLYGKWSKKKKVKVKK